MTFELFTALLLFALVSAGTPGPNNMMLMASGANFGFRRTIPHMLGIGLGHAFMIFLVGLGVMQVFEAFPVARTVLTVLSVLYMSWLAWKIAHSAPPEKGEAGGTPLSFLQAAGFQWVNPKAWTMALTAITLYAPDRSVTAVAWVTGAFLMASLPSTTTWTVLGRELRRFLTSPERLRVFNWTMAVLLMLALVPALMA